MGGGGGGGGGGKSQNLPPPVSLSSASFTGNILYYNRACAFLIVFNYTNKGQVKESQSKADFCQDICVICVFWRYMQLKQLDDVKIIIYYVFLQPFISLVSRFQPPEDSRLPLFPLPPPVTFLLGSRPLSPLPPHNNVLFIWGSPVLKSFPVRAVFLWSWNKYRRTKGELSLGEHSCYIIDFWNMFT